MAIEFMRFEDIKAWKNADELAIEIYKSLKTCNDFGFKDQIQRAVVSIMNNIAEGFERNSKKAFYNHLGIAKGSCGEVRSMLILGHQLNYFSDELFDLLNYKAQETSKMIFGLIKSL